MKYFWALPAFMRLAICTHPTFSVHNDLLAFPQYEIIFPDAFVSAAEAEALLASHKEPPRPHAQHTSAEQDADDSSSSSGGDISVDVDPHQNHYQNHPHIPSDRDTHERIVFDGRPHICTIPYVPPPSTSNGTTPVASQEEQQAELARATDHGLELLKDMQGHCIYYTAGWWVYSFCYNDGIRQFHPLPPGRGNVPIFPPVEDRNVHSYLLGQFPDKQQQQQDSKPEGDAPVNTLDDGAPTDQDATSPSQAPPTDTTPTSQLQTRGSTNYLVQKLTGGTECDLTGQARRVEVQFHCNPSTPDRIHMIKETASCVYLMVIHTPRLCNDVAFLPPQEDRPHAITCREVVASAAEEEEWHARTAELDQLDRELAQQEHDEQQARQASAGQRAPLVIGGIVVGGRTLVGGTPEQTIKASQIVAASAENRQGAAGPEKFLATLAKSDGRYTSALSEKEMGTLGLDGTRGELDRWIRKMQELAGEGVAWKLDVVRTPGGLEFRGILMPDGAGEEGEGEGKGMGQGKDGIGKKEVVRDEGGEGDGGVAAVVVGDAGYGADGDEQGDGEEAGSQEEFK